MSAASVADPLARTTGVGIISKVSRSVSRTQDAVSPEEISMRETDIFSYFAFGYNYYILRLVTKGVTFERLGKEIDDFFEKLEELNLQVTNKAAGDLRNIRAELRDSDQEQLVDVALAERVKEACNKLDATLDAELQLRNAFIVTPKRFDLRHLLESPGELLGQEAQTRLPALAKFDFSSACRAIAFGLPTAAAFHLMRCVEGMLREYYCSIVKRGRIDPLLWFAMLNHLKKRRDAPPRALVDHLDNIRANFRNPTQHPDARYDLEEAQDLLAVTIDALNRMSRDLAQRASPS
jgi:hypothetical protein